jgi:sec-independent protein translocase protein TatC
MTDAESFISHLVELRTRLVRAVASVGIVFVALFLWPGSGPIYDFLSAPLMHALPQGSKMIAIGVVTPFLVPMKVTALVAFLVALPYVLYQLWAFVAPGLYEHERKLALPVVISSTILFLMGVAFCYYVVFVRVFTFIQHFAPASITPAPDIEAYFSFVITMFLAFGVTFEIPILVMVLVRFGIVSVEKLRAARPYVIVGAFIAAAIVTPPDAISQFMLAIPMCLLFEAGLFVGRFVSKRADEAKEGEETGEGGEKPMTDEDMDRELDRS